MTTIHVHTGRLIAVSSTSNRHPRIPRNRLLANGQPGPQSTSPSGQT